LSPKAAATAYGKRSVSGARRVTLDDEVVRLGRTRPFDLLPREAVQLIAFSCEKRRLRAGEALFFPGERRIPGISSIRARLRCSRTERSRKPSGASAQEPSSAKARFTRPPRGASARAPPRTRVVIRISRETFRRVLAEFPAGAEKIRAALAARTRLLVDGLEATRIRSFDGSPAPRPRAAQ